MTEKFPNNPKKLKKMIEERKEELKRKKNYYREESEAICSLEERINKFAQMAREMIKQNTSTETLNALEVQTKIKEQKEQKEHYEGAFSSFYLELEDLSYQKNLKERDLEKKYQNLLQLEKEYSLKNIDYKEELENIEKDYEYNKNQLIKLENPNNSRSINKEHFFSFDQFSNDRLSFKIPDILQSNKKIQDEINQMDKKILTLTSLRDTLLKSIENL